MAATLEMTGAEVKNGSWVQSNLPRGYNFIPSLVVEQQEWHVDDEQTALHRLSPTEAADLYKNCKYEHNRKESQEWIEELAKNMTESSVDLAILPNGKVKIANGHHTLQCIARKSCSIPVFIRVFQLRTASALSKLYATFDNHKTRSVADAVGAAIHSGGIDGRYPKKLYALVSSAVRYATRNYNRGGKLSHTARLEILCDHEILSFLADIQPFYDSHDPRWKSSIVAGFYSMWKANPSKAIEFITRFFKGSNLEEGSPILAFQQVFNKENGSKKQDFPYHEYLYYAWGFYLQDKQVKNLKKRTKEAVPAYDEWPKM